MRKKSKALEGPQTWTLNNADGRVMYSSGVNGFRKGLNDLEKIPAAEVAGELYSSKPPLDHVAWQDSGWQTADNRAEAR